MQTLPSTTASDPALCARLEGVWERTGHPRLRWVLDSVAALGDDEWTDWVSTALMACYKETGDAQAFALLFERNRASFTHAILSKVRRCGAQVDAGDVLQEVFLNIYRYPHRFLPEKADAFRNWGHRIVRNTLLKFLKGQSRVGRFASLDDEAGDREDPKSRSPYLSAQQAESAGIVDRAYLIYLHLYLQHFNRLSAKEQRALTMVEVHGASYKETAAALGIRLENLKMVIFRGRRKIFRGLSRTLDQLNAALPSANN